MHAVVSGCTHGCCVCISCIHPGKRMTVCIYCIYAYSRIIQCNHYILITYALYFESFISSYSSRIMVLMIASLRTSLHSSQTTDSSFLVPSGWDGQNLLKSPPQFRNNFCLPPNSCIIIDLKNTLYISNTPSAQN